MEFHDSLFGCYHPFYKKVFLKGHNKSVYVACPCGKCIACYRRYEKDWSFRMREEMAFAKSSFFLTLTYNDDNLVYGSIDSVLVTTDYQLFLKRLRKSLSRLDREIKLRYVVCGEYGTKGNRPHYHFALYLNKRVPYNVLRSFVEKTWNKGFIQMDFLNSDKIHYLSKYFNKLDDRWHEVKTFRNMSNGIGRNFLSDNIKRYYKKTLNTRVHRYGNSYSMPRYYRDRIFNSYEKEVILLNANDDYIDWLSLFHARHGFCDPLLHYQEYNTHALEKAKISSIGFLDDDSFNEL